MPPPLSSSSQPAPGPATLTQTPNWHEASGCLRVGAVVVKRVRFDAAHQRQVLGRMQQLGWPVEAADPLSPRGCRDRKVRARQTVRALNRGQRSATRVVFHAARDLLGYRWELIHE